MLRTSLTATQPPPTQRTWGTVSLIALLAQGWVAAARYRRNCAWRQRPEPYRPRATGRRGSPPLPMEGEWARRRRSRSDCPNVGDVGWTRIHGADEGRHVWTVNGPCN